MEVRHGKPAILLKMIQKTHFFVLKICTYQINVVPLHRQTKKTNTAMRNETELRNALKELEARIDLHRECSYNTVIIAEVHALKFALGEVCAL